MKRNPPQWTSLSVAQADEYLTHAVQSLLTELPFRRKWSPESAEKRTDPDSDATSM